MSALLHNQEPLLNVERADVGPQNTIIALLLYQFFKSLKKLDVGRHSRILNTTQNWVVSKAFRSIAHQTCTWRQCYIGHKVDQL